MARVQPRRGQVTPSRLAASALPERSRLDISRPPPVSQKTWGGRFSGATDNRVEAFTESISFDQRLYRQDIAASQAHARMLAAVKLLTPEEADRIVTALDAIAGEIDRGEFAF